MKTFRKLSIALSASISVGAAQDQIPISASAPPSIPLLGFGTWNLKISSDNTSAAVSAALLAGYRHLDCAAIYGNEKEVGRGVKDGLAEAGVEREDIWITSKLWNDHHRPDLVEPALDQTLKDLGLDYLDLYLMHWPVTSTSGKNIIDYLDTWHAMTALLTTGKTHHIGVSNFSPAQLKDLIAQSSQKPFAHQFEAHPYLQQPGWVQWHKDNDIHVTAYSPLANLNPGYGNGKDAPPSLLEEKEISEIAKERGCTNAQVALKWGMDRGTSVIPKSSHVERIMENYKAQNCTLERDDYETIGKVGKRYLTRFNDPSEGWGVRLFEGLEGT